MRFIVLTLSFLAVHAMGQNHPYTATVSGAYQNGISAFESDDFQGAKYFFKTCIETDSLCFEAYLGLGQVLFAENKPDSALLICEKAIQLRPFSTPLTGLMGRCYFYTADYTNADLFLKRALSIGENSSENNGLLGLTLQKMENYREALHYFDRALNLEPTNAKFWYNRGVLHLEMDLISKAKTDFEQAQKLAPTDVSVSIALAQTLFALLAFEEALQCADEGLKNASATQQVSLLVIKGNYYYQQGDYQQALLFYDQAADIEQGNPVVLTHQASAYLATENFSAAVEKCNAALAVDPEQMEAYFNRGIAREMMRDIDGACADWQRAFILGSQRAIEYLNGPVCNE